MLTVRSFAPVTVPIRIVDAESASPEDFEVSVQTPDGREEKLLVTGTLYFFLEVLLSFYEKYYFGKSCS